MDKQQLIDFEKEVARHFESGIIHAPIHLSGGNEDKLIEIFADIDPADWVFSTHRSHYHALLHGVPRDHVLQHILNGKSMNLNFPNHRFYTSAIVGGILPIALGVAAGIKRKGGTEKVWAFIGDMAATTGIMHEVRKYAACNELPLVIVMEDNHMSTDSPTVDCWGPMIKLNFGNTRYYAYERQHPHVGTGKQVTFV